MSSDQPARDLKQAPLMGPEQRPVAPSAYFDVALDDEGRPYIETRVRNIGVLRLVLLNKGSAFSPQERRQLQIDGLLPTRVSTLDEQIRRAYRQFRAQHDAIAKYQFLRGLQERQEVLFHALVSRHLEEMAPIVYTPTVGEAVENFSALYQTPRGLTVHDTNIDHIDTILDNFPMYDVRVMVVTDSSAILGIGDQGYGGMGISIGKLTLYTVGGGVAPWFTLPVALDVGTDHADHQDDPLYLGAMRDRLRGREYDAFVERFVKAVRKRWPEVILQWEDLSKEAAFRVLERYHDTIPSLNDDIQGTGAITLAAVIAACRTKGETLSDQVFCVHGAGAGGIGVARALRDGLMREGLSEDEALARIFVLDSRGLLLSNRQMEFYKKPFAHDPDDVVSWTYEGRAPNLVETLKAAGATVLLGLSGQGGCFDQTVVGTISANTDRPVIFPLSNPTRLAEATPADLLAWTDGMALVATGSPFEPVTHDGETYPIAQANNAFVFPGLGLGAMVARVERITDDMVLAAAYAVAEYTIEHHGDEGLLCPPLGELSYVSKDVAMAVVKQAVADGVAREPIPEDDDDLREWLSYRFWKPAYVPVVYSDRPPYPSKGR